MSASIDNQGFWPLCRFATPQRTPRAEGMSGRDRVLAEAINLQAGAMHLSFVASAMVVLSKSGLRCALLA